MLDAHQPGPDGVDRKVDTGMLDIGECCPGQITNHMGRYSVNTADLLHLEAPGFEKLRFVVGHTLHRAVIPYISLNRNAM